VDLGTARAALGKVYWRIRRKAESLIHNPPRPKLDPRQAGFVRRFYEELRALPAIRQDDANEEWVRYHRTFRAAFPKRDVVEFRRWPEIIGVFVNPERGYIGAELRYLQQHPEWTRWRDAILETPIGRPHYCWLYRGSSSNLIHHVYHLCRFEEVTRRRISEYRSVLEFGGGFGSFARLCHQQRFRGTYLLYDLDTVSCLQRYFLDSCNVPSFHCISSLSALRSHMAQMERPSLFVGTWSISESPLSIRVAVMDAVANCDGFLIAYLDQFGGVDNREWFSRFRGSTGGVKWESWGIPHLPRNYYLVGSR
jgi:hypothetical protein